MPMTPPSNIDGRWVDIVPPAAPHHGVDPFVVGIVMLALLVMGVLLTFIYRRPRQRAKSALRRLARDLRRSRIEIKPACLQVRHCLHAGLGRRRLQSIQWHADLQAAWLRYLDKLGTYCFAAETPTVAELESVIREAREWLNKKAVEA
jgi:7-keto-8-aminopelargonate synthetase-like enzyme